MNRFYSLLLTAVLIAVSSWNLSAQVQFSVSPQTISASVNQQISFDIKVNNFTQVEGYQFSYAFDPTKLEFLGFGPDLANPILLPSPGVNHSGLDATLLSQGKITVLWGTQDGNPKTLPNNTTIATLVFKSKIAGSVAMGFSDKPLSPEVFGPGVSTTNSVTFTPALNTIGGGGGNNPCSPDVTPPTFSNCPATINLTTATTCATATWTAPTATDGCGTATVTQIGGQASGNCFPLGSTTITYRATDAAGNTATCAFNVVVSSQTNGGGDCVSNWTYPTGLGSELALVISEEVVKNANDEVNVKVMTSNFNLIQGITFSVSWETANLQYVGIVNDVINLKDANVGGNMNLTQTGNGRLGFIWSDPSAVGVTVADKTVLFEIRFKKLGTNAATIAFSDSPVVIGASKDINGQSVDIANITKRSGKVSICSGGGTTTNCTEPTYDKILNVKQVVIPQNGEVCVDFVVNENFTAIEGLQFSVTWNAVNLQFTRVESAGTTVELGNTVALIGNNKLNFSFEWTANPLTLSKGATLFRVCYQAAGGLNSVTPIEFTGNNEVTKNNTPQSNVALGNGSVTIKPTPNPTATNTGICNGTGSASVSVSTAGNFAYVWTTPSGGTLTGSTVNITTAGIYSVKVTDLATCLSGTAQTTAVAGTAPTINSIVQDETGLSVSTSASTTVEWAAAANPSVVLATSNTFNSPQAGIEYIAKVGTSNCTQSKTILAIGVTNSESSSLKCANINDGKISLTITGATNLNYSWSNNSTSKDISNLTAGSYTVTITSADGKVNTIRTYTLTAPSPLTIAGAPVVKSAPNGSIEIDVTGGTGNLTYNWTGVGNLPTYAWPTPPPFTTAATQDIFNLEPGTYSLTITDANGCSITSSQKVDVAPIVVKLAGNAVTHTTCAQNNGAAELIIDGGSGTYNYQWSGPTQVGNTNKLSNLAPGEYKVTVTDAKYTLITTYSIFINPSDGPIIAVSQVTDAGDNCKGAIDIAVAGGASPYAYKWAGPTANIADIQDPTSLCEGTYTVSVTDARGCVAVKTGIVVSGAARPCPTVSKLTQPKCNDTNDGAIEITVTAGKSPYTYVWQKDGKAYSGTTAILNGLTQGTYGVTVTDNAGKTCASTAITLTAVTNMQVTETVTDPVPSKASNGAVVIAVTGGSGNYTYNWENNIGTTNAISNLKTGYYTVTVTDNVNGCKMIKTVTVGDPGAVEIQVRSVFNGVNVTCYGVCNGIAEVKNIDDATPPLKYKWSNGDTSRIAKGLCAGTYKVTVTDANSEKFEGSVTLVGPNPLVATVNIDYNDKSATANVSGGTAPYFYRWGDDSTSPKITNVSDKRVFVMITDANGCATFKDTIFGQTDCLTATPVITPNNDSYNDVLEIYCLEKYILSGKASNLLEVYNRWGQLVFSKQNYENRSWTAVDANGNPLPNGAYYYIIEVYPDGKTERVKGFFTVINGN